MSALIQTIGRLFDPVLNFFQQVWGYITSFLSFLWDLIEGLYYGFNTIISNMFQAFSDITGLTFFIDNLGSFSAITSLLGTAGSSIFFILFYVSMCLVVLRFVFSLIPFFHSSRK